MRISCVSAILAAAVAWPAPAPADERVAADSDATFVELFERYMTVRQAIDASELETELRRAELDRGVERNYRRLYDAARRIDLAPAIRFHSEASARNLNLCLPEPHCRWYAVFVMRYWAMTKYTVTRIARDETRGEVELQYSGVDGTGMSGSGSVVFVREAGEWKIAGESFGPEGSIRRAAGPAIPSTEAF